VGAGHSDYIKTAEECVMKVFSEATGENWQERKIKLRDALLGFFAIHIAPWAYFPASDRPSVELLIAVTGAKIPPSLFHYRDTAFSSVRRKSIGSGVLLAQDLLDTYGHKAIFDSAQSASLGCFILDRVKNRVAGCGGPTHIVALRTAMDFALTSLDEIQGMEGRVKDAQKQGDDILIEQIKTTPLKLSWHTEHKTKKKK